MLAIKKDATEVRKNFAEEVSKVAYGKQNLVIERHGKPLAAVIPMEAFAAFEKYIEQLEDKLDIAAFSRAKAEMKRTGERPIPWEEVKRKLDRMDEARARKANRRSKRAKSKVVSR